MNQSQQYIKTKIHKIAYKFSVENIDLIININIVENL